MKKIFLSVLSVAFVLGSLNARDLVTAEWNLLDAASGGVGTKLLGAENTGGVADTLANGCIIMLTHPKSGAGCSNKGLYVHNSNAEKGDNFLAVTVPGGAKGELTFSYTSGSGSQKYDFYALTQDDTLAVPSPMYELTESAVLLGHEEPSKSKTMNFGPIAFDFTATKQPQTLYIFHVSSTGGRFTTLKYAETELAPDPVTGLNSVKAATSVKKMMVDGQIVIMKDDVKMNILGF